MEEVRIGGKYKICKRLGRGAFGALYWGFDIKTNEEVAIKLESLKSQLSLLMYEAKIYEQLKG